MSEILIMIKIVNTNEKLIQSFEDSYLNKEENEYNVKPKDVESIKIAAEVEADRRIIAAFIFEENTYAVEYMYLGEAEIRKDLNKITYKIAKKINSKLVISNFLSYSELDLKKDFKKNSYINVEYSEALITQIKEQLIPKEKETGDVLSFIEREEEKYLHSYAQHNQHCQRLWGIEKIERERAEFQRDRERIVNSRAFRRMVDKAQIFTSSKGDHYRTRMTHTLEVAQIARSIANSLQLNIDLTEAIALGHDLGHTPFGHQGERTLDDIINGRTDVLDILKFEDKNPYGGFKHNFQSLRMLTKLEEKYVEYSGLNISYQVLEGVLKHTSNHSKECIGCTYKECKKGCCDFSEFVDENIRKQLYSDYEFATTLEGQVVAIADEIAQRSHDIDDAFSSGLLEFDEFRDYLKLKKLQPLNDIILDTYFKVLNHDRRIMISQHEMLTARVISDIIGYLVNDVVKESRERMKQFSENDFYKAEHRFNEKLIDFSAEGGDVCYLLEKLISKRAINCLEVTRFDRNASMIVKFLFQAYYQNPKLIHSGTLRRMYIDMLEVTDNVVDFVKGDPVLVREELKKITEKSFSDNISKWSDEDREYYVKRKILVRNIVDFIAGMTDNYAINEYNRLK